MKPILLKQELKSLKCIEDNWDGYGASKPLPQIIDKTEAFIDKLNPDQLEKLYDIYPNPHATVSIEFKNNNQKISLEIGIKDACYFYRKDKNNVLFFNNFDLDNNLEQILNHINELIK